MQHPALDYHDAGTMHAVIASDMVNRMPIPGLMGCIASDHSVSLQQKVGTCKQALADMPQEEFVDNRLTPEFRNFSVNPRWRPVVKHRQNVGKPSFRKLTIAMPVEVTL